MSKKIPAEDVIKDIKEVLSHEEIPTVANYLRKGKYKYRVVHRIAPDWTAFVESLGLTYRRPPSYRLVSEEDLEADLTKTFDETGSTRREDYRVHGKYDPIVVRRVYGGWNKMLKKLGYKVNTYKPNDYSKEDIIKEYRELEKQLDCPITAELFRKYSSFSQTIIDKSFGSFTEMQRELGKQVDGRFIDNEEILQDLKAISNKYGIVSKELYDEEGMVSFQTIQARFGSLAKACKKADAKYDPTKGKSKLLCQCLKLISDEIGSDYVLEQTFDWLRNPKTGAMLRLDIYYPQKQLAIEIDGGQHYKPYGVITWEDVKATQQRDRIKDKLCAEHEIKLVRFTRPSKKAIKEKLGVA